MPTNVLPSPNLLPFVSSAPGKVIISGEHSAVYNKPTIAASVSGLRTYFYVEKGKKGFIQTEFADINFSFTIKHEFLSSIPKEVLIDGFQLNRLHPSLLDCLEEQLKQINSGSHRSGVLCFLYLYSCLCSELTDLKFIMKSTIPYGAGLGSSASFSVCLVLAMGKLAGHIAADSDFLTEKDKEFVNHWSLIGEMCIHDSPSGIDNAVATCGNAILFRKQENNDSKFNIIKNFPQLPIVVTNTKIFRSTKALIANVGNLLKRHPIIVNSIIENIGIVVSRVNELLPIVDSNPTAYTEMLELVRINHGLLVSLGVSHPSLEIIRSLSDTLDIGSTKLTGAGGGGCAFTLLKRDADIQKVRQFIDCLVDRHGYESFTTELGGIGCCYLHHSSVQSHKEQIARLFNEPSTNTQLTEFFSPEMTALKWVM